MLGWAASELARLDPGERRRVAMQEGYPRHCRPLCWHVDGLHGWLLERKGFATASGLAVGDMVASMQQLVVVAGSWEPVVRMPREGSRDMEVARPGV